MNYWDNQQAINLNGIELKTYLSKKRIIKYLYRKQELTATEISGIFHLSLPTTLSLLKELLDEGFIEDRGKGNSMGGRRPNVYGIKDDAVYIVGIDLRLKAPSISIFNGKMEKVAGLPIPVLEFTSREKLLNTCTEVLNKTIKIAGIERSKIMGVGVNMPGLIDSEKGINFTYLYQPDKPLSIDLGEKLELPVFLENDTKARTLAEMRFGAAREVQNALVLQIDWGLGLGMVLNGKLFKGNSGFAGEFSHIPIDEQGILCKCGKIGCLETLASGMALVRVTQLALEQNMHSKLTSVFQQNKEGITPALVIAAALDGDHLAIEKVNQVGQMLGKGLSYLVQILNPQKIILSGTLAQAGQLLILPLRQALQKHCLPKLIEEIEIVISPLGEDVGTMGSASVVIEQIIEN